jgi:hypothetical protein
MRRIPGFGVPDTTSPARSKDLETLLDSSHTIFLRFNKGSSVINVPTREVIRITTWVYFTVQVLKAVDRAVTKEILNPLLDKLNDTNKEN